MKKVGVLLRLRIDPKIFTAHKIDEVKTIPSFEDEIRTGTSPSLITPALLGVYNIPSLRILTVLNVAATQQKEVRLDLTATGIFFGSHKSKG